MKTFCFFHSLPCLISVAYAQSDEFFVNSFDEDQIWHIEEQWFVNFGIEFKLFDMDENCYDGHSVKSITIFGLKFSKGYTYNSQRVDDFGDYIA